MSGTRVLRGIERHPVPTPVMPADLASQRGMSESPPLRRWTEVTSPRVVRRSFTHLLSPPGSPTSPVSRSPVFSHKKRVVFADTLGLALATVCYYSDEEEEEEEEDEELLAAYGVENGAGPGWGGGGGPAAENGAQAQAPAGRKLRLWLGFAQPAADFLSFHARLQEELVLLESCRVTADSLSGTIRARNMGFKKVVQVRVTFDSWRSYRDEPCTLQPQVSKVTDSDLYTFSIPLPESLDPKDLLEFCISCRHGRGALLWDKNKGQNYRIHTCPETKTPAASLLASHRSSLLLHTKRRGAWDSKPQGPGRRSDSNVGGSHSFRSAHKTGDERRGGATPASPGYRTDLG